MSTPPMMANQSVYKMCSISNYIFFKYTTLNFCGGVEKKVKIKKS